MNDVFTVDSSYVHHFLLNLSDSRVLIKNSTTLN